MYDEMQTTGKPATIRGDAGPDALYTQPVVDDLRRQVADLEQAIAGLVDRVQPALVPEPPSTATLAEGTVQLPHNRLTGELVEIGSELTRLRYWVNHVAGRVAL